MVEVLAKIKKIPLQPYFHAQYIFAFLKSSKPVGHRISKVLGFEIPSQQ